MLDGWTCIIVCKGSTVTLCMCDIVYVCIGIELVCVMTVNGMQTVVHTKAI